MVWNGEHMPPRPTYTIKTDPVSAVVEGDKLLIFRRIKLLHLPNITRWITEYLQLDGTWSRNAYLHDLIVVRGKGKEKPKDQDDCNDNDNNSAEEV